MKKIFLLLLFCTSIICAQETSKREEIPHYFGENKEIVVHNITDPSESFDIIEITYNGETHQFIRYHKNGNNGAGGLTHWPGCKYCKQKEQKKEQQNHSDAELHNSDYLYFY